MTTHAHPAEPPRATGDPDYCFSRREVHVIWATVVLAVASYVIGGYPLGLIRLPFAVYWITCVFRYLRDTRFVSAREIRRS